MGSTDGMPMIGSHGRSNSSGYFVKDMSTVKSTAQRIFEKKFQYRQGEFTNESWTIGEQNFFQEYYEFPSLLELEEQLNQEKSKLNDFDIVEWSAHTRKRDPSSEVVWKLKNTTKVEFGTVAWCKFYECLHKFPLVKGPHLNSLHLCEAPGAFIAALNHFLHSTYSGTDEVCWKWLATTLNPYYEGNALSQMIADDRFIRGSLNNWYFYEDFTGNIMNRNNINQIEKECSMRLDNEVHLITADGSVDCWEQPDLQEETVSLLHWAEIITALSILANGGCFVLKMFTLFKAASVSKLFLLNCVFESVHAFKPATSKQGNSEVYIICIGYRKNTPHLDKILELIKSKLEEDKVGQFQATLPLFGKTKLPKDFLMQHEVCVRLFMSYQMNAIGANINSYTVRHPNVNYFVHMLRTEVTKQYYERYNIQPLPSRLMILQNQKGNNSIENNQGLRIHKGSYSENQSADDMKVSTMFNDFNELEKILSLHIDINYTLKTPLPYAKHDNGDASVDNVHAYYGKEIATIQSSLFTNMPMFLLYKKVIKEYNKTATAIWQTKAKCNMNDDDVTIATWNDDVHTNYALGQQSFFESVLKACAVNRPNKLRFINLLVLSHYSASILRYLSLNIFDQISITSTSGGVITLSIDEQNSWENRMPKLEHLRAILQDTKLFCIMRLNDLHGNEFKSALIHYNNRQLRRYINKMLTGFAN